MSPVTFMLLIGFLFGLAVGSFLNVVIWRLPRGESVVFPASHCPKCGAAIAWYDNLPLVSYLLLGGKCRHCRAGISARYPVIEVFSGVALAAYLYKYGVIDGQLITVGRYAEVGPPVAVGWIVGVVWYLFTMALLVVTVIDLEHKIIPNSISLPGIPIGLLLNVFLLSRTWRQGLIDGGLGILIGGGVLLIVAGGYYYFTRREGMGMGDPKLLGMIGAFIGWKGVVFAMIVASFVGTVVGVLWIVLGGKDRRFEIPFGPFLSLGGVAWLWLGPAALRWYLGL